MRAARFLTCLALAGVPFGAARAADPPLPPAVASLLTAPEHRTALLQAAHAVDGPGMPACPDARYTTTGDIGLLQPVRLDSAGKPVSGAWKEQVRQTGCGIDRVLNAMTVIGQDGMLQVSPLLPGTTIADPQLQQDSVQYAASGLGGMPPGCQQGGVFNTRFVGEEGGPPGTFPTAGSNPRPWTEIWTLQACAKRSDVEMSFTPTPRESRSGPRRASEAGPLRPFRRRTLLQPRRAARAARPGRGAAVAVRQHACALGPAAARPRLPAADRPRAPRQRRRHLHRPRDLPAALPRLHRADRPGVQRALLAGVLGRPPPRPPARPGVAGVAAGRPRARVAQPLRPHGPAVACAGWPAMRHRAGSSPARAMRRSCAGAGFTRGGTALETWWEGRQAGPLDGHRHPGAALLPPRPARHEPHVLWAGFQPGGIRTKRSVCLRGRFRRFGPHWSA